MDLNIASGRAFTVLAFVALLLYTIVMLYKWVSCLSGVHVSALKKTSRQPGNATGVHDGEAVLLNLKCTELAISRRLEYSILLLRILVHIGFTMLLVLLLVRHAHGVWDIDYEGQELGNDPIPFVMCLLLFAIVVEVWPLQLTCRKMDCLHILAMARLMWQVSISPSSLMLVFQSHGITAQRLCFGLTLGNPTLTWVLNVCFFGMSTWSYLSKSQGASDLDKLFMPGHAIWFIFDEAFATLIIVATVYAIDSRTLAEAKATMTAKVSRQAESTLNSVLLGVCDAVVRLSQDYHIRAGFQQLSAFLLRTEGATSSLKSSCFMDFLDPADRERFQQHIQGTTSANLQSPATSMHVHMRDANGTLVACQLFNACFHDLDGKCGYLIGIREFSNEEWRPSAYPAVDQIFSQQSTHLRGMPGEGGTTGRSPVNVGRGTPALVTRGFLATDATTTIGHSESSDVSVASSRSSRSRAQSLAIPQMKSTSCRAIDATLIQAMVMWNVAVPRTTCCSWHAYTHVLKRASKRLAMGHACNNDFEPVGCFQCSYCGLVVCENEANDECLCGMVSYVRIPAALSL